MTIKSWLTLFLLVKGLVYAHAFVTTIEIPCAWVVIPPKTSNAPTLITRSCNKKGFHPSLTLVIESIQNATHEQYLNTLPIIYKNDHLQKLGTHQTSVGVSHIFHINKKNTWGEISILQSITFYQQHAIVITGSFLKKEFLKHHQLYLNIFKSLAILPSILNISKDPSFHKYYQNIITYFTNESAQSPQAIFESLEFQNEHWTPFINYISLHFSDKGLAWQALIMQQLKDFLFETYSYV